MGSRGSAWTAAACRRCGTMGPGGTGPSTEWLSSGRGGTRPSTEWLRRPALEGRLPRRPLEGRVPPRPPQARVEPGPPPNGYHRARGATRPSKGNRHQVRIHRKPFARAPGDSCYVVLLAGRPLLGKTWRDVKSLAIGPIHGSPQAHQAKGVKAEPPGQQAINRQAALLCPSPISNPPRTTQFYQSRDTPETPKLGLCRGVRNPRTMQHGSSPREMGL